MDTKAVIFDLDGVVSDTQRVHAVSESQVLRTLGVEMEPDAISARFAGILIPVMLRELFPGRQDQVELVAEFENAKWKIMEEQLALGIGPVAGSQECVARMAASYRMAIGSASPISFIERVLVALDIRGYFGALASSEECERGKPSPDVFLLAAERLDVLPDRCVVVEDGIAGMKGARSGGMKVIALDPGGVIDPALADAVVSGHEEITSELVNQLLAVSASS